MFKPIYKNLISLPNNLIGVVIPMFIFGIYGLFTMITQFEWINLIYFLSGYFVFMIMGITIGYHRYFCHKSFVITSNWKKQVLLWSGALAGQGSPIFWTLVHRGYHHRHPDTEKDPHSPIHGFWHSFIWWMFRIDGSALSVRYAADLLKDKHIVFLHDNYIKIFWGFNILLMLVSFKFFLFFSMLPCLITLMSYNITNTFNHRNTMGYRNFETKDFSHNVPILFPLVLGECWHNNHHGRPGASHFGSGASGNWWEFDPAGTVIKWFRDAPAANRGEK